MEWVANAMFLKVEENVWWLFWLYLIISNVSWLIFGRNVDDSIQESKEQLKKKTLKFGVNAVLSVSMIMTETLCGMLWGCY